MRSFLSINKKPVCKWGSIPPNTFFEGDAPKGYELCVSPHYPYCIIDIDNKGTNKNGFNNIPQHLKKELDNHFNYDTPSGGKHIWIIYSGHKSLLNKTSNLFIDLRTEKGYVCWYYSIDIRECIDLILPTSKKLNKWIESLFSQRSGV